MKGFHVIKHIQVLGEGGISATIIRDSINPTGNRLITMELEYPRFILAELNTHRMLSKNSASSRAIPVKSMHDHIRSNTARPVFYGKNQSGMVAKEELNELGKAATKAAWDAARDSAISHSTVISDIGNHKQVANRLVEPFQMMKTIISGTEWENFFWLRYHKDAQPEFQELAKCMYEAVNLSTPQKLTHGMWHLPYVDTRFNSYGQTYWSAGEEIDLITARKISASCCAQVSYRKNDDSIEKALKIFDMLNIGQPDVPPHLSPVEHQASAMFHVEPNYNPVTCEIGTTHIDTKGRHWSGNFCGWIQYRKLLPNG